jgi:hypothetical protein
VLPAYASGQYSGVTATVGYNGLGAVVTADSYAGTGANIYDQTRSYPAVDEKISVVNRHIGISQVSNEDFPGRHQVYQENWYDALGDGCW